MNTNKHEKEKGTKRINPLREANTNKLELPEVVLRCASGPRVDSWLIFK